MDILCPRCGEPWHTDTLHEIMDEAARDGALLTYSDARRLFQKKGCGAVPGGTQCEENNSTEATLSGMLFDVLGDDVDGIAAELADYDSLFGE